MLPVAALPLHDHTRSRLSIHSLLRALHVAFLLLSPLRLT